MNDELTDEQKAKLNALTEMLNNKVPLDPELARTVRRRGAGFQVIQHPLLIAISADPLNAIHNEALKTKKEALQEAIEKKDFDTYVMLHEKPFRVDAIFEGIRLLKPEDRAAVAQVVLDSWSLCEWPSSDRDRWVLLFFRYVRGTAHCADAQQRAPKKLYRGVGRDEKRKIGLSWTANRDIAVWFAKRSVDFFRGRPMLYSVQVSSNDVLAMCLNRKEEEFIIDPRGLPINKTLRLSAV